MGYGYASQWVWDALSHLIPNLPELPVRLALTLLPTVLTLLIGAATAIRRNR